MLALTTAAISPASVARSRRSTSMPASTRSGAAPVSPVGTVHSKQSPGRLYAGDRVGPPPPGLRPGAAPIGVRRRVIADDDAPAVAPAHVAPGQVDQRGQPVAAAEQRDQVQAEPGQPGQRPAYPDAARQLDDRAAPPDRRHDPLVVV